MITQARVEPYQGVNEARLHNIYQYLFCMIFDVNMSSYILLH